MTPSFCSRCEELDQARIDYAKEILKNKKKDEALAKLKNIVRLHVQPGMYQDIIKEFEG